MTRNNGTPLAALALLATLGFATSALGQALPNPYRLVDGWAKLPGGREIGAVGDVDIDVDGRHVWAILRCDAGGDKFGYECLDSNLDVVVKFAPDGNAVTMFGGGEFIWPHGLEVDPQGNVWVTDAATTERTSSTAGRGRGHQVVKFSPSGEVLMRLGTPGVPGNDNSHFNAPSDVVVAPNGDIFVADGHDPATNNRVVKFRSDGTFVKAWGRPGEAPGELLTDGAPHRRRAGGGDERDAYIPREDLAQFSVADQQDRKTLGGGAEPRGGLFKKRLGRERR